MANSNEDRLVDLAVRLLPPTLNGQIRWSIGERQSYIYVTPQSAVSIRNRDNDGDHPFVLEVFNGEGEVVDALLSKFIRPDDTTSVPPPWNAVLENLYSAARRNALDIDVVLDNLLDSLPGEPPQASGS
jgi:hypothetical protein